MFSTGLSLSLVLIQLVGLVGLLGKYCQEGRNTANCQRCLRTAYIKQCNSVYQAMFVGSSYASSCFHMLKQCGAYGCCTVVAVCFATVLNEQLVSRFLSQSPNALSASQVCRVVGYKALVLSNAPQSTDSTATHNSQSRPFSSSSFDARCILAPHGLAGACCQPCTACVVPLCGSATRGG